MNNLVRVSLVGQDAESVSLLFKFLLSVFNEDLKLKTPFKSENTNTFSVIIDDGAKDIINSIVKARAA